MSSFLNITLDNVGVFGSSSNNWSWQFSSTDTSNTTHTYKMINPSISDLGQDYYISYNWTTRKWFDSHVSGSTWYFDDTATGSNLTARESSANLQKIYIYSGSSQLGGSHSNPYYDSNWSAGPTVTSITVDTIFVPSDTVSNTDFTLLKNGSAYANTNISLTGPGVQPPTDARGYTYSLTYDGTAYYRATIDSKSYEELYYDDSWTSSPTSGRSTNSNRILNVLGTIPTNTSIKSGGNTLTSVSSNSSRTLKYSYTADLSSINLSANTTIDIIFFVEQRLINNAQEIIGAFYEIRTADSIINYRQSSPVYIIGNQETITHTQNLMGVTTTFSVTDWVYSAEPEGDGYVAPVSTTSNGGGKPDRYPLIMTNLFNRNRSLYSIGMTHKDTWDLFL